MVDFWGTSLEREGEQGSLRQLLLKSLLCLKWRTRLDGEEECVFYVQYERQDTETKSFFIEKR